MVSSSRTMATSLGAEIRKVALVLPVMESTLTTMSGPILIVRTSFFETVTTFADMLLGSGTLQIPVQSIRIEGADGLLSDLVALVDRPVDGGE